jgi:hypothetical protein
MIIKKTKLLPQRKIISGIAMLLHLDLLVLGQPVVVEDILRGEEVGDVAEVAVVAIVEVEILQAVVVEVHLVIGEIKGLS